MLWYSFVLAQRVRNIDRREPFDVVEGPEWGGEGFVLSQWRSVPLAVKLHAPSFVVRRFNQDPRSVDHRLVDLIEKKAIVNADLVTCPSHSLAGMVAAQFQIPQERIHIVRNPIDHHFFSPGHQSKEGPETILFVGRLNRIKGVYTLAQAIAPVARARPGASFVFAGADMPGPQPGRTVKQELLNILIQHRVADCVRFLPSQTRLELLSLYRASDICVVPSLYDNLPFACLEAMACGKPVVASQVGGITEIIQQDETGLLVPPNDPQALADALIALLEDRQRRQALGHNARTYIEENFSCVRAAEASLSLYSQIGRRRTSAVPSTVVPNSAGDRLKAP
jgi:glycosyltransferase involved in cell wall biosynthesis